MKNSDLTHFSYLDRYLAELYQSKHLPKIKINDIHNRVREALYHQTDFSDALEDIWPVVFDSISEVIFLIDKEENILGANRAIERWKITDPNLIKGKNIHQFLHPWCFDFECGLKTFCRDWYKTFQTGETEVYETEVPIMGRFLQVRIQPLALFKGTEDWMNNLAAVVIYDITEKKQLENQFIQASSILMALFKIFPDLFLILDDDGKIITQHGGRLSDFCITCKDLRGQNILNIFPKKVAEQYQEAINQIQESLEPVTIKYFLPSFAGEQIFEAKFLQPFENQVLIIIRNVTEKCRLESMAETMETINNLGFIFAGIRHEICNPINTIKMVLSVLKDNLARFPRKKVFSYINQALDNTERIEYLLRLLKNFSIYEKLTMEDVQVKQFIQCFLNLLTEDFSSRGINIRSEIPSDLGTVCVDPRALQQVMLNIMSNAADAVEGKDGALITITVSKRENQMNIVIKDNGHGIIPDVQKRIFKPFFTTKKNGTGLGLVISEKLLLMMNCNIKIKSVKDIGTSAIIQISPGRVGKNKILNQ